MIRIVARDTSLWSDDVWLVDSTPVVAVAPARRPNARTWQAGPSTATAHHTRDTSGGCVCTWCAHSADCLFALTGARADERETLRDMLETAPDVLAAHPGQTIIGDKNYFGREFEYGLAERHLKLLRPVRKGEAEPAGSHLFKPLRQVIESINQTFKGQLNLERHGGKSPAGVSARVLCRILALTAAIWHNDQTGQPVKRSLTAYDH